MRLLLSLIITIFSILKATPQLTKSKNNLFNSGKKIQVTGHLNNYIPADNNRFITFRTYDLYGRIKDTAILIDKKGLFNGELFQPFEGDINLMYNNEYLTLYSYPGELIKLKIDANLLSSNSLASTLIVNGKSAPVSKLILDFQDDLKKQKFKTEVPWDDKSLSDESVASIGIQRVNEELNFLSDYAKKRKINNQIFLNWQKNQLLYSAVAEILFESASSRRNKTMTVEKLMNALKDIPINNKFALHNSAYYSFLARFCGDIMVFININPAYEQLKKDNGLNAVPLYLKEVNKYSDGLAKQILYYNTYFFNSQTKTDYFIDVFNSTISDPYLKKLFITGRENRDKGFQFYNIIDKIKQYKADDTVKSRLLQVFQLEEDNYIYLDFWAPWCTPCIHEMQYYSRLTEDFKNSSISFLFFSIDATKQEANEIKNKYHLNGKFILLNDNERRLLNNVMGFSSLPQHFLLNSNRDVIENILIRLSTEAGYKIAAEKIRKYLSVE